VERGRDRRRLLVYAALAAVAVSVAAFAVTGLVLGRHVVEVRPGPPVVLDYNGSTVVVAAPFSRHVLAEPARVAGRQLSPCVEYTLSVRAEGLRGYRYVAVLVAGNSSIGLYAGPGHEAASAVLCTRAPAEVAVARSVVVEAGRERGRLEATLAARAVDPEAAKPSYWPAWARPGAYAVYSALIGRLEARVLDAGPGYAVVEQRASDSLGLGLVNTSRIRVGFQDANEKLVFLTRKAIRELLGNATRQGCGVEETRVDVAGRSGVEAVRIACPRYTLYISPGYGLLLRASAGGVYVELEDTNILPAPRSGGKPSGELRVLPTSRVYGNGTLVLELEVYKPTRIVKVEACGHTLRETLALQPGSHRLRLPLPTKPAGNQCIARVYTETGNIYTAMISVEKS